MFEDHEGSLYDHEGSLYTSRTKDKQPILKYLVKGASWFSFLQSQNVSITKSSI